MKAKWLWMTWAHLSLVGVIALEAFFIWFLVVMILPKFEKLQQDGYIDPQVHVEAEMAWVPEFLDGVKKSTGQYGAFWLLAAAAAWGLFEWCVRSEHKAFIRLSALGTAALALLVVVVLTAGILVVSFCLGMPAMGPIARPFALEQVATLDTSMSVLDQALAEKDWKAMEEQAEKAAGALNRLSVGPALTSVTIWNEKPGVNKLRAHVQAAQENLRNARQAVTAKDAERVATEMAKLRKNWEPVREAVKRPPR